MDNAGGYGTEETIKEYVRMLEEKYNVKTIFQIPRSPYTNVLDLGVWCSLQAKVEKEHFGKRCEVKALANLVITTWEKGELNATITSVFKRLKRVLALIIEAKGKNDLVEEKRGKKWSSLDLLVNLTDVCDNDVPELEPELLDEEDDEPQEAIV